MWHIIIAMKCLCIGEEEEAKMQKEGLTGGDC